MHTKRPPTAADFTLSTHPRTHYVFDRKVRYNHRTATFTKYASPVFVWKSKRDDYIKRMKSERRKDSVARSRMQIYDIVESNLGIFKEMPVFATFTFAENVVNLQHANSQFRLFIRRLNRELKKNVAYLTVIEFQKRGAVHYHTIFFNLPFIHKNRFEDLWGNGFTNIQALAKINNVSAYVSKYLTKETFDSRLYGQKVYFCSRYLLRSKIERDTFKCESVLTKSYTPIELKTFKNKYIINYEHEPTIC